MTMGERSRTATIARPAGFALAAVVALAIAGCGDTIGECAGGSTRDPNGVCVSAEMLASRCAAGTTWDGTACVLGAVTSAPDVSVATSVDASPTLDVGGEPDVGEDDPPCVPECDGAECGPDLCGGTCGSCPSGTTCGDDWTCVDAPQCEGVTYEGQCEGTALVWCEGGQIQRMDCATLDGLECASEPDSMPLEYDCLPKSGPCVPDCDGKVCGDDGCGGSCGTCKFESDAPICWQGGCVAIPSCTPSCEGKVCGGDGCGGVCGFCDVMEACEAGACAPLPADESCVERCGLAAPSGCLCTEGCGLECCADFIPACLVCKPACDGKQCGDDGCGGTCGACGVGQVCGDQDTCIDDPCTPDPCMGLGQCEAGVCDCQTGFAGAACEQCAPGYVGYPTCTPNACQGNICSYHGACQEPSGLCMCDAGFSGAACDSCESPDKSYPNCAP
jgi:hypothetical protein